MDETIRRDALRGLASELGVDPDLMEAVDSLHEALERYRADETARMAAVVEVMMPRITAELTRDFLRPALRAAGFDGDVADRYEVSYGREPVPGHAFRPGVFEQEGDGRCGWQVPCVPWPKADES